MSVVLYVCIFSLQQINEVGNIICFLVEEIKAQNVI